jgi:hypothetical protein
MKKKHAPPKNKIDGPFAGVTNHVWLSPAWKAMSPGARLLYIALLRRYDYDAENNGRIFLSQRKAAEELGCYTDRITRWFRELQYYGFIVMVSAGRLGVRGRGRAPHWRLTELPCNGDPATKEFLAWNGVPFGGRKNRTPSGKPGHPVRKTRTWERGDNVKVSGFSGT